MSTNDSLIDLDDDDVSAKALSDSSKVKRKPETIASLQRQLDSMVKLCAAQREKIVRLQRELAGLRRRAGG